MPIHCPYQDAFTAAQAAKSAVQTATRLRDAATKAAEAVKSASPPPPGDDSINDLREAAIKAADAASQAEAEASAKQLAQQNAENAAVGAAEALKSAINGRKSAEDNAAAAAKYVTDSENALAKAKIVATTKAGAAKAASERLTKAATAVQEKQGLAAKIADAVASAPPEENPKVEAPRANPPANGKK